jgi:hypothetical protein
MYTPGLPGPVPLPELVRFPPIVRVLPPSEPNTSSSNAPLLVKPTVVVTAEPPAPRPVSPRRRNVPALLASLVRAVLVVVLPIEIRASAPSSSKSDALPIAVIPPPANSSIASPLTRTNPVAVVGAAPVMFKVVRFVAPLAALPCKKTVPVLLSPVAVTVVAAVRPVLPI